MTEHFNYLNNTGSTEWKQVADASHDVVNIWYTGAQDFEISLNDGAAGSAFRVGVPGTSAGEGRFLRIENPNKDVWVRLSNGHSIDVIRGDAKLTVFGT